LAHRLKVVARAGDPGLVSDDAKRISRETIDRVDGLTEEARTELARSFAGRVLGPDLGGGKARDHRDPIAIPYPGRGGQTVEEIEREEAIARVTADLHRTHRRLDRIERTNTGGRYQVGGASAPSGRYARLLSRAHRLERELRALHREASSP
jgi:hypothetical protein